CSPNCLRTTGSGALPGRKPFRRAVREISLRRCSTAVATDAAGTATSMRRSRPDVADTETCINEYPRTSKAGMRKEGLEPSRVSPLDSKSSASTSSATFARVAGRRKGIIAGSGASQSDVAVTGSFQLLQLIADEVADAALQQSGDIRIELAVLPPQRGDRHDHGRANVLE